MYRLHQMDLSDPVVRDKAKGLSFVTINRVCGEISVSRSIGDPDYKRFTPGEVVNSPFLWPDKHDQVFQADLLIPEPECRAHSLVPGDEFLVLASDGLWDVVVPEEAVKLIGYVHIIVLFCMQTPAYVCCVAVYVLYCERREAFALNKSPSEAAEELCELAIKLGSSDNVTIVITRFMHSLVQN